MQGSEPRELKSREQIATADGQRIARDVATPVRTVSQEVSVKSSKRSVREIFAEAREEGKSDKFDSDQQWESNLSVIAEKFTEDHIAALGEYYADPDKFRQAQARAANEILNAVDSVLHGSIFVLESTPILQGSVSVMDLFISI